MRLRCVIVHYHTPALAVRAVEAFLRDAEQARVEAEVVLVDNGSDETGKARLSALPVRYLPAETNLGYAGALNRGLADSDADFAFLMNADVEVQDGCVSALIGALRDGASAAGPCFFLDREKQLVLPPTEVTTKAGEVLRQLATHGDPWTRLARQAWRRHARRHWSAVGTLRTWSLSGALIAIRLDAWRAVGPFDEGYRLYFEEVDWLLRLERSGGTSVYVAHAHALHLHNQSAAREPRAAAWFAESRLRFLRRYHGDAFTSLVNRLAARDVVPAAGSELPPGPPEIGGLGRETFHIELSPRAERFPAASAIVDPTCDSWRMSDAVWESLTPGDYALTVVDAAGHERAVHRFTRPVEEPVTTSAVRLPRRSKLLSDWKLRELEPGDEHSLNVAFDEAFGVKRPIEDWYWKFPTRPDGRWVMVAVDGDERVIAHFGAVPVQLQVDGRVVRAGHVVDVFSLRRAELVHGMVFVRLVREFYRRFGAPDRLALLFGVPSERHLKLGRTKLDYGDPVPVPVWRSSVARRWARPNGHRIRWGFDADAVDRLWQRAAPRYPTAAIRDASWFARRYRGRPGVEYVHVSAWRGGDVAAWAVVRFVDGLARWAEVVWDGRDPRAILALDDATTRIARAAGAQGQEMWLAGDREVETLLAERGWQRTLHPKVKLASLSFDPGIDGNGLVERMYLTLGDSDLV